MASYAQLEECRDYLLGRIAETPQVGIVCGSGLHLLSELVEAKQVFQYHDIPHFPRTTVAGHQGELVFGRLQGVPVVMMKGRFHFYEGHSAQKVCPATCAHCAHVLTPCRLSPTLLARLRTERVLWVCWGSRCCWSPTRLAR